MAQRLAGFGLGNRMKTTPIPVNRTNRVQQRRVLTSGNAGDFVPVAVIPLLREDSLTSGQFSMSFEMSESVEVLANSVNIRMMAHLVPKTALARFTSGMDSVNRSYEGLPEPGGAVIPWFETQLSTTLGVMSVLKKMGLHWRDADMLNTEYIEAYNVIWNFLAKNRSPDLTLRSRLDTSLAPAFWTHQNFAHIVPDFDQAVIDGEVALNIAETRMPVSGLGLGGTIHSTTTAIAAREADGTTHSYPTGWGVVSNQETTTTGQVTLRVREKGPAGGGFPDVFAEMQDNGITVSLSNIELARKTQAFANLRRQYNGHSDEYIIDLLMDGITIPDQAWKQPILLADETTVFGMSKRYASDGASLTESVVNGMTAIDMRFSCPRVPMGGVIMITMQVTPEQLFERQQDPYLIANGVEDVPQFLRDTLDPEKVVVVQNREVDTSHASPTTTFGYAPLNHQWARSAPNVGGKFYRPSVDSAFDEDRQRIWAVETANPTLSKDFYLCTTMHYKPFVVTSVSVDHFECLMRGATSIRGNTVFGGLLVEATNDYAEVMEEAPMERIQKDAPTAESQPAASSKKPAPVPKKGAKPAPKATTTPNEANK